MSLTITFLGTGTSTGVPEIGCECQVCLSNDSHDKRLRSSLFFQTETNSVMIDTSPDLRQQCLREKIANVNSVFYTHLHADHFFGLDDLRRYNIMHKKSIEIFLPFFMKKYFCDVFGYTLRPAPLGTTVPNLKLNLIDQEPIKLNELIFEPLCIFHGSEEIRGYSIRYEKKHIVYITDCKVIPKSVVDKIRNADILILGAIWKNYRSHVKHFDLLEALQLINEVSPKCAYLTHFSHRMGLAKELENDLPTNVFGAYDGLKLVIN
ncbi:MAG: MBL fold metallo-hydrolase [Lentisphaeria bacterium]